MSKLRKVSLIEESLGEPPQKMMTITRQPRKETTMPLVLPKDRTSRRKSGRPPTGRSLTVRSNPVARSSPAVRSNPEGSTSSTQHSRVPTSSGEDRSPKPVSRSSKPVFRPPKRSPAVRKRQVAARKRETAVRERESDCSSQPKVKERSAPRKSASRSSRARAWWRDHYSAELVSAIENKSLSAEHLSQLSLTEQMRIGSINRYTDAVVHKHCHFRGLPWCTHLKEKPFLLMPYQEKIIPWMIEREQINHYGISGGMLYLEMGLGKTLAALATALANRDLDHRQGPTLVLASKSVGGSWQDEINKFFRPGTVIYGPLDHRHLSVPADEIPPVRILLLHRSYVGDLVDKITRSQLLEYDLIITTYQTCRIACYKENYQESVCFNLAGRLQYVENQTKPASSDPAVVGVSALYTMTLHRVVVDESQNIGNHKTDIFCALMALHSLHSWCLTGTPISNNIKNLWSQLRFMGYGPVKGYVDLRRPQHWTEQSAERFMREHSLHECIYQMNNQAAGIELPPRHNHEIYCQFSEQEQAIYDRHDHKAQKTFDKYVLNPRLRPNLLTLILRMRQSCISSHLVTLSDSGKQSSLPGMPVALRKWVSDRQTAGLNSAKMNALADLIADIPSGEKILVFSMFTNALHLAEEKINQQLPAIKTVKVTGKVNSIKRRQLFDQFRHQPSYRVLFLGYLVGSEGINLAQANHVVFLDPWWSPVRQKQSECRVWRSGQTREVHIYDLLVKGTIEDRILELCREKVSLLRILDHENEGQLGRAAWATIDARKSSPNRQEMARLLGRQPADADAQVIDI